jgi:ribosomal protein L17
MTANQREVISRFETAIALAGIEFGRIDLAIQRAEEIQQRVESLVTAAARMQEDFALTTDKIRKRSNSDVILNHLKPFIYGLFGALLTLLVLFAVFRFKSS